MARIHKEDLFSWDQLELSPELKKLEMLLNTLEDGRLMNILESERKHRRDDFPVRMLWNTLLAGTLFQHISIESLRRELLRNAELRSACGIATLRGEAGVPSKYAYTRFIAKLRRHLPLVEEIIEKLVKQLSLQLPAYGERMAFDTKAIKSHAVGKKDPSLTSDPEANWGVKDYQRTQADGTPYVKKIAWFGYKLSLIVDADYELPIAYKVTPANVSDTTLLRPMLAELHEAQPEVIARCKFLSADKGLDSEENNRVLYDEYGIKPVIDIRGTWNENKGLMRPLDERKEDTLYYTEKGEVLCRCQNTADEKQNYIPMSFRGFEKDRKCLKYVCPKMARGIECTQQALCKGGQQPQGGRIVRIPLETNRRIFTPLARSSHSWTKEYKQRTSVERVNSRIDRVFGMEEHFIRGLNAMKLQISMKMMVMLGMAVGWIAAGQANKMRSLVQPLAA